MSTDKIVIKGAREHNLKNVDVTIPRDSGRSLTYYGTILLDKKPPLP